MALNLRAGSSFIPGYQYSATYSWNVDVPTGTGILGIFNPTTKQVGIIDIACGGWTNNKTTQNSFIIYKASAISGGTSITPARLDSTDPVASALIRAGGTWTLGNQFHAFTLSFGNGFCYTPISLPTEMILNQNEGLVIVFTSESSTSTFLPNASFMWYEV